MEISLTIFFLSDTRVRGTGSAVQTVQCFATLPAENAVFNPSSQALSWSFGFERAHTYSAMLRGSIEHGYGLVFGVRSYQL